MTENTSFSKSNPNLQLVYDTVSTGYLKECARKYQLAIVEGWQPKRMSPHLFFGLITHSSRETYDKARAAGDDHEVALRKTVRHCLEAAGERIDTVVCRDCGRANPDDQINSVPKICVACNSDNVEVEERFFPWRSTDKNKNRYTLLRTVVWYLEHYKDSPEETVILSDGSPAVELWFRFELPLKSPEGTPYILTGHIDRLVSIGNSYWFADLKTTKNTINERYFDQYSPDNQMSFYTAGGKIVLDKPILGGIIDAAQVAIDFTAFQRGFLHRTTAQIDEWLKDIQIWIKQAESYAEAGYWPMNDKSCGNYGGCQFREVCNKDPSVRKLHLKTNFTKRVWDPLKKRGI